ncbi:MULTISPECIES: porin [Leptolyngbya]|uniref:porin n=1 Tax=Leptolyngbya TaxID=47251 RepID=UPI0016885AB6|nr:porin [Leptolyngbya sp. FACHB-1624]MBD1855918.1 porin [Leptolyngbya sp. FACHB-1624]
MSDLTRHAMTPLSWVIEVFGTSITVSCVAGLQVPAIAQSVSDSHPSSKPTLLAQSFGNSNVIVSEDEVIRQVANGIGLRRTGSKHSTSPPTATLTTPLPPVQPAQAGILPPSPSAQSRSTTRFTLPTRLQSQPISVQKAYPTPTKPVLDQAEFSQLPDRQNGSLLRNPLRTNALTPANLVFQGIYLYQGDETSARARLTGVYPLSPNVIFGGTVDVVTGRAFSDTPDEGFNVNELYVAVSPREAPGLRFVVGQLDLTSYFDRNSFAKDGATHFFNSVFQTNPALSATGISSRPGALVNLSLGDHFEAKAAVFSSARGLTDFALDAFVGEVGVRAGNLIVRGTYATDRDAGSKTGFDEIFSFNRGNNQFGLLKGDREEAYGVNAELFIPNLKLGLFGRYGRYNNLELNEGGDTYSFGFTFLDVLTRNDRFGIGYGRGLSNAQLQREDTNPNVLEVFYDFRLLSGLRLGFSVQSRNDFTDTIAGVRLRTEFDVLPRFQFPE